MRRRPQPRSTAFAGTSTRSSGRRWVPDHRTARAWPGRAPCSRSWETPRTRSGPCTSPVPRARGRWWPSSPVCSPRTASASGHTSPHVYSLQERFTIDGLPVDAEVLLDELLQIVPAVEAMERGGHGRPSFFEVTNGLAFRLFADRADYSVIETGLGGLLDSTTTTSRTDKLAVITPIGVDHVEVLGRTPAEIATQKAGI